MHKCNENLFEIKIDKKNVCFHLKIGHFHSYFGFRVEWSQWTKTRLKGVEGFEGNGYNIYWDRHISSTLLQRKSIP